MKTDTEPTITIDGQQLPAARCSIRGCLVYPPESLIMHEGEHEDAFRRALWAWGSLAPHPRPAGGPGEEREPVEPGIGYGIRTRRAIPA